MVRNSWLGLFVLLVAISSCGTYESHMRKGEKFLAIGEYYDASEEFKTAYRLAPAKEKDKRGTAALKLGNTCYKLNYSQRATAAYANALRYGKIDSLTSLHYGQMLLMNGNYKEAEKVFYAALHPEEESAEDKRSTPSYSRYVGRGTKGSKVKETKNKKSKAIKGKEEKKDSVVRFGVNKELEQLLIAGLTSARNGQKWKEEGSEYVVKKMAHFNSRRSDYSPMLLGDESDYIYFTSTRNEAQGDEYSGITGVKNGDIFFCQKDDKGKWTRPAPVEGGLNTEHDEGTPAFTPDAGMMYLTQCAADASYPRYAQIMTSSRSDAAWGTPSKLNLSRDTLSSFAHPAISPDGDWLYFVSDMPGGKGGLDIWRVRIAGGLGGVENIGEPVNTPGDEMFPAFRPNGDFYFSSNGHPGMGGQDIYIAKLDTTGHFKLEHPGYPLNSQGDDFGMTFEGVYNRGYFSSNRGDGKGWDHIYSFEKDEIVQVLKGWVYEMDGYELPMATVYLVGNDGTNLRITPKSDGSFTEIINPNVDYIMLATCKGYLNHREELRVDSVKESQEYVLQFPLPSIGAPVLIKNIFFDFDKATLRPESATSLDKLVEMLNENPNVTIELGAHTDYHGADQYNERLSQKRAQSVCNYLIQHGIDSLRLTPKGYGEKVPKTVTKKMAERYEWLKEGDVLTEDFVKGLADKDKETYCNQINRRTEFRVLKTTYGLFDKDGKLNEKYIPKPKKQDEDQTPDDEWLSW